MATSKCDYIGCFQRVVPSAHNHGYCDRHQTIGSHLSPLSLSASDCKTALDSLSTSKREVALFNDMLSTFQHKNDFKPLANATAHELRQDIMEIHNEATNGSHVSPSECCPSSSSARLHARQKHTHEQVQSKVQMKHKLHKRINRLIRERNGEKITEEYEDTEECTERVETLAQFKSETELEVYAEESTERYESKMIEYARNREMVFAAFPKWLEELLRDQYEMLPWSDLLNHPNWDLFQKQSAVCLHLWKSLIAEGENLNLTFPLPVIQEIQYYTIETFPDGPRKVFHCKFASSKLDSRSLVVSVPELLLRAFPVYEPVIHAFFVTKFIPFRKIFMKHRRQQELMLDTGQECVVDQLLDESEEGGFRCESIPEINPSVCYTKAN